MRLGGESEANGPDKPGAIGRVFAVLSALAGNRGISFGELERSCNGVARATLVRLVRALRAADLVDKKRNGTYALGPECFRFARRVLQLASRGELVDPVVQALADATDESAAYFEFDGRMLKLLTKVEKGNSFHYVPVGTRVGRPHIHVFAKVILAFSDESFARAMLEGEPRATTDDRLRELNSYPELRAAGIFEGPEEPGTPISRVVAPVRGADGTAVGAIGVTLLGEHVVRERLDECGTHVLAAASRAGDILIRGSGQAAAS